MNADNISQYISQCRQLHHSCDTRQCSFIWNICITNTVRGSLSILFTISGRRRRVMVKERCIIKYMVFRKVLVLGISHRAVHNPSERAAPSRTDLLTRSSCEQNTWPDQAAPSAGGGRGYLHAVVCPQSHAREFLTEQV